MKNDKYYYWHGTKSKKSLKSIINNGLNKYSYLTQSLGSALAYGGPYLIKYKFNKKMQKNTCVDNSWQWINKKVIKRDKIVGVYQMVRMNKEWNWRSNGI